MIQKWDLNFRKRHQVFEFGDQHWLPSFTRDGIRSFLNATHQVMGYYKPWAKVLAQTLQETGQNEIVVLGGGGIHLCQLLQKELRTQYGMNIKFYLTDLYPVQGQSKYLDAEDDIVCIDEPVNMLNVPSHLKGLRMIAVAFHHLAPEQAKAALKDSYDKGAPICVFEYTKNSLIGVISSALYPIFNLLIAPLTRPFRFSTFLLSYVIPYFPIILSIDGLCSNLRTYSKEELREMTSPLSKPDYQWVVMDQIAPLHPTTLTTLIGQKRQT